MSQPVPKPGQYKRKTSVTVREDHLNKLRAEGKRQRRSISFLLENLIELRCRQIAHK